MNVMLRSMTQVGGVRVLRPAGRWTGHTSSKADRAASYRLGCHTAQHQWVPCVWQSHILEDHILPQLVRHVQWASQRAESSAVPGRAAGTATCLPLFPPRPRISLYPNPLSLARGACTPPCYDHATSLRGRLVAFLPHTPSQAAMVLVFMFSSSWRLTVVTFILIPVVMVISKVRQHSVARHTLRRVRRAQEIGDSTVPVCGLAKAPTRLCSQRPGTFPRYDKDDWRLYCCCRCTGGTTASWPRRCRRRWRRPTAWPRRCCPP